MIVDTAGERLTAVLEGDRVVVFDLVEGTTTAQAEVAGAADLVATTGGQRLVVDMAEVTEPGTLASTLASVLDDDDARIRALLVGEEGVVTVAATLDTDQAINVQEAIDAGELPGASIESGDIVAVAATEGLVLLDATSLGRIRAFPSDAPVTGGGQGRGPGRADPLRDERVAPHAHRGQGGPGPQPTWRCLDAGRCARPGL